MLHCTYRARQKFRRKAARAAAVRPAPSCFPVRLLAALALLVALAWPGTATQAADAFLSVLEDVPLASGLTEAEGEAVMFDSPAGRIVTATAEGALQPAAVDAFYAETLPQLGWQPTGVGTFRRESEVLRIETASRSPAGVTVHFRLRPADTP